MTFKIFASKFQGFHVNQFLLDAKGSILVIPFNNFSWCSTGTMSLSLQAFNDYEGGKLAWRWRPLSSHMPLAIVILMVLWIKEYTFMQNPGKILMRGPIWVMPPWHCDIQGGFIPTHSRRSHSGNASNWDQGHCPTPPMKFHYMHNPVTHVWVVWPRK